RYLGTWYEIASFPASFQRGCTGTTATYSLRKDGDIEVVNRCYLGSLDGRLKVARGRAWVPDPLEPGRLKVRFFWPFTGDYLVLEVPEDYRYAVVGSPSRKYCWILNRTPAMDEQTYQGIVQRLQARGYDVSRLVRTLQPAPAASS
ncbi:MAG: lipocalin family protein, partial [Myxococcaceae bacterium]